MNIRAEEPMDHETIQSVVTAAFAPIEHSRHTEARIIDALRSAGALDLGLVATGSGGVLGYVAFSSVTIDDKACGWFGLGPLAVRPERQGEGIGTSLVREGLARLRAAGARGCVVLGEPAYYGRFAFRAHPALHLPGVPPTYFQALAFQGAVPSGEVAYHWAFNIGG
jgi:putative acetyltransferase